ncbi:hypothetical protein N9L75_03560 [Porticoccaceae bacterium]|nr:hypothetical protein [Porticoccaceae bacterium]MDA8651632.1 hypothetical protein [Porticoccaceae bacterium]MDA8682424.1 hypothetical protein [Porticoccaceae bacterium]MDB2343140.1 hypothetical protein [Porticoccaceae bacterium]MDB2664437.1 hypothetical protein [Porticoccaceae bacterium]
MDLFEEYESQPPDLKVLCDKYLDLLDRGDSCLYAICKEFLAAIKPLGYTFEYGLDGEPFNLKKIDHGQISGKIPYD